MAMPPICLAMETVNGQWGTLGPAVVANMEMFGSNDRLLLSRFGAILMQWNKSSFIRAVFPLRDLNLVSFTPLALMRVTTILHFYRRIPLFISM